MPPDCSTTGKATRRPRGTPRLLLLDAAPTLFAGQDYRGTMTREIADTAGVLEHLLFRQFGSKAALFTLWTADALTEEELQETGVVEIDRAIGVLGRLGGKGFDLLGIDADHQDLAARSTVAMVAGMAAFGTTFFGGARPPRDVIVEEVAQATLHGFLHRGGRDA